MRPLLRSIRAACGLLAAGLAVVCLTTPAVGQPARPSQAPSRSVDPAMLESLRFRNIGPATTGGRIVEFAVVPDNTDIIYAATASGGAWKTINGGTTWAPVFDHATSISIGAIAVSRSNRNLVWIGTGEANQVRSSSWGDGIYKSEDGGKSWKNMGLKGSQHVGRVLIHPTDPDVVYVAALGALWGSNEERGLYKTKDGGTTWTRVLGISRYTGVVDVAMDPRDPDVLYAAAFQRERRYYSFVGGGPEGGLFKSTDAGTTWVKVSGGFPTGEVGRIGVAICASEPDRLYAAVVGPGGGIFRSDDRGASWEQRTDRISTHWYYGQIYCDPANPERVYVPMTRFFVSDDGGRTFRDDFARANVHGDHHTFWVNPQNPRHMIVGNDGGIYISRDAGATWDFQDHLSIAQFYTVAVDMQEPFYHVYGGTQDNSSYGGPSGTRNSDGIVNDDWFMTVGGDGFYLQIDPTDPTVVYSESQYGNMFRFDTRTGERRFIQPQPADGTKYRWNWSAPILVSPHANRTVYTGANMLFKSTTRGDAWTVISPDLSRRVDEYTLPLQDKVQPRTAVDLHSSTADYGNVTSISESPRKAGVLAVGTDDGLVHLTRDDGKTWAKTERFPGVAMHTRVSRVVMSRFADDTVYVTFDAHQDNDFRPYVFKSTDFGKTWISISASLPDSGSVHVIVEHIRNPRLLFVGTEFGVFMSINSGTDWTPLRLNLPTVAVHDIAVHPRENDLVVATHGRGFWILDDLSALESLTPETASGPATLYPLRRAVQFNRFVRGRNAHGQQAFVAPNPPDGAIITYFAHQGDRVEIDVLDGAGSVMRRLAPGSPAARTGMHRLVWDLRYAPPLEDTPGEGGRGPFVFPGAYRVRLKVGAAEQMQSVNVSGDPLVTISDQDRKTWHDTLVALSGMHRAVRAALATAEHLDAELKSIGAALGRHAGVPAAVTAEHQSLSKEVGAILLVLRGEPPAGVALTPGPPGLVELIGDTYNTANASTALPTADQAQVTVRGHQRLGDLIGRINTLSRTSLPALTAKLDAQNVAWTAGRPLSLPPLTLPRLP